LTPSLFRLAYKSGIHDMSDSEEFVKKAWGVNQDGVPAWQKAVLIAAMPVLRLFIREARN
jgi:hypothetical protein